MPSKSPIKRSTANRPDFSRESDGIIAGCDEAGRGPLAGPVTAACVFIPHKNRSHDVWHSVRDSKMLTAQAREDVFAYIQDNACFGIASSNVDEIAEFNILQAAILAMRRATEQMCAQFDISPDMVLIDGSYKPRIFPYPSLPVVKGDSLSITIAAASILAKVTRDRIMQQLHEEHPHYGWNTNAGYGTPTHMQALKQHGPCVHHRKAFAPVRELLSA